jgi:hypothetical protein
MLAARTYDRVDFHQRIFCMLNRIVLVGVAAAALALAGSAMADETGLVGGAIAGGVVAGPIGAVAGAVIGNGITGHHRYYPHHYAYAHRYYNRY